MTKIPVSFQRVATRCIIALILCANVNHAYATDSDHPVIKRKFDVPPSAELSYTIRARQSGFSLSGDAVVKWRTDGKQFNIEAATNAMIFGKILEAKSEGNIDDFGLAPSQFMDKRIRKAATITTFNRDTNSNNDGAITFSDSDNTYPLKGGEQDRTSIAWQLSALARATPQQFKPGSEWRFFVAGQRDAEAWTFTVVNREKISTGIGEINAVHLIKTPDAKQQKLEIWLAPSLKWYPIRLRFTDPNNDFIDQTLDKISQ